MLRCPSKPLRSHHRFARRPRRVAVGRSPCRRASAVSSQCLGCRNIDSCPFSHPVHLRGNSSRQKGSWGGRGGSGGWGAQSSGWGGDWGGQSSWGGDSTNWGGNAGWGGEWGGPFRRLRLRIPYQAPSQVVSPCLQSHSRRISIQQHCPLPVSHGPTLLSPAHVESRKRCRKWNNGERYRRRLPIRQAHGSNQHQATPTEHSLSLLVAIELVYECIVL